MPATYAIAVGTRVRPKDHASLPPRIYTGTLVEVKHALAKVECGRTHEARFRVGGTSYHLPVEMLKVVQEAQKGGGEK